MLAVIKTGGKQYRVKEGDVLSVEKLEASPGKTVTFEQVLLIEDEGRILVGNPYVEKATVNGEVMEVYKDDKVTVFKKKRRKGYRRTRGHRQMLTKIKIAGIYPERIVTRTEKKIEKVKKTEEKPAAGTARTPARKSPAKKAAPSVEKMEKPQAKRAPRKPKKAENKE
ncbi:MAG: 50S ribosomal protein L21 [Acidobacteriota bacterium]|nr:50S ribosomal protein L21 [Acidobacteriota bacterium]